MKYHLFLSGPNQVVELEVESDTALEPPSNHDPLAMLQIGKSLFPQGRIIAVVSAEEFRSRSHHAAGE